MKFVIWVSSWIFLSQNCLPSCYGKKEKIENDFLGQGFQGYTEAVKGRGNGWSKTSGEKSVETCGTGKTANFWFITKHVSLHADVIYVDVEGEFDLCYDPRKSKKVPCISDFFTVYIYRGDEAPVVTLNNILGIFSFAHNITSATKPSDTMKTPFKDTFSFNRNSTKGVTLAVRSKGSCGKIFNITMYHYYCEERFIDSVRLKRTSSPETGFKLVPANCSDNSMASDNTTTLKGRCYRNGSWSVNEIYKCLCSKGYESNEETGCTRCSNSSYKNKISNSKCIKCPKRKISNPDKTSCICETGFYSRSLDINNTLPCYALLKLNDSPKHRCNNRKVTITWNMPEKTQSLDEPIFFDVECVPCETCTCENVKFIPSSKNLSATSVTASNLQPNQNYTFRVYPKNKMNDEISKEKWNYKETELFSCPSSRTDPPNPKQEESDDDIGTIVIAVIVVVLVLLIIVLVVVMFRRRGTKRKSPLRTFLNNGVDLPSAGHKPYVDPSNYSNAEEAVEDFANELDPRYIFLEKFIGGGEFGDVYKGVLTLSNGKKIPVAAKTLKRDASAKSSRDFMLEASVMAQFDNPYVVKMEGVITKSIPRMIVIEYMSNGSLENYLKSNDGIFTRLQLLGMAKDVAAGMNYLAEIKFVHRDLAARNILVNGTMLCKISDFGLSRELEETETESFSEYATTGGKIPLRWTAPEAIKYRKFSTASDVWSFGILLWEIMSFAQRPYWEWDNFKVMEEVDNGFRLPPPQKCPFGVHSLMLQCWKSDRRERPSFGQITIVIDRMIRSPETMDDEVNFFITIGDWLTSIKMGSYKTMFIEAGYQKQSDIVDLTDEDLKNIGITLIGHRNKIMKGIETLRARKTRQPTPLLPRSNTPL